MALAGGRADGEHALALARGYAEGEHAIAAGYGAQAKGDFSTAIGRFAVARGYGETVVGNHNTEYNPKETKKYNELDRAFSVGIGYSSFDRPPYYNKNMDGLIVFKNGRVLINNAASVDGAHTIVKGLAPAQLQVNAQDSDGLTIHTDSSRNTLNLVKAAGTTNSTFTSFGYSSASDGTSYREIGSIKADGGNSIKFNTSSDIRLKNDLGLVTGSLNTLMQVKIHEFTWKSNGAADVGVFAQELHEVLPTAVEPGDNGAEVEQRWLVDYAKLTPLTVAAVQELHQTIATQQQHIASLEQQLLSLGEQVQELQAWRRQSNV